MRRIKYMALAAILLWCVPARATTPAYVRSVVSGGCQLTTAGTSLVCTPSSTTTSSDDVLVGISLKTTTRSVKSVTSTASGVVFLPYVGEFTNSTNALSTIWVCHKCNSISTSNTITITLTGTSVIQAEIEEYSGVTSYGQAVAQCGNTAQAACASSANPQGTITLQDANNIIVMVSASIGSDGIPTSSTGNLRDANRTANATTGVAGAFCDNTASSGAVTCKVAITSSAWSSTTIELRGSKSSMTHHVESYGAHNFNSQDGTTGQDFIVPLSADFTLSGNSAVCWDSRPSGTSAPTVTSDKSDAFGTADKTVSGSSQIVDMWHVATTTGAHTAKFHFSAALAAGSSFTAACSTFSAALTVDPGTTPTCGSGAVTTGPLLNCGALTLNDADVIFVVTSVDGGLGYAAGGATPGGFMGPCREGASGTILIPANMTGYCSEFFSTAGSGTPNPQIYLGEWSSGTNSANTTNQYNIVGVAYALGTAGTAPSGVYIAREWQGAEGATTGYVNCASTGNFISSAHTAGAVYTVQDSNQVTWTKNQPISNTAANFNTSTNSSLDASSMCSLANTDANNDEAVIRDIYGVAATNAIVAPSSCPSPSTLVNSGSNIGCYNTSLTGTTPTQTDGPDFTPANSGDLILDGVGFGTGPSISCSAPTGCLYDCPTYTTQGDGNGMCFGEGHMHYYTTATSALNFGWNMGSGSGTPTTGSAAAIEIKAASTNKVCTITLLGAGPC